MAAHGHGSSPPYLDPFVWRFLEKQVWYGPARGVEEVGSNNDSPLCHNFLNRPVEYVMVLDVSGGEKWAKYAFTGEISGGFYVVSEIFLPPRKTTV